MTTDDFLVGRLKEVESWMRQNLKYLQPAPLVRDIRELWQDWAEAGNDREKFDEALERFRQRAYDDARRLLEERRDAIQQDVIRRVTEGVAKRNGLTDDEAERLFFTETIEVVQLARAQRGETIREAVRRQKISDEDAARLFG